MGVLDVRVAVQVDAERTRDGVVAATDRLLNDVVAGPGNVQIVTSAADKQVIAIAADQGVVAVRSEEHTSEIQSLMRSSYAVFCLKKKQSTKLELTTTVQKHIHS